MVTACTAIPQRLKLRGGRTMISGSDTNDRAQINPGLINALKRTHADLIALQASPFTRPKAMIEAVAPATQHDRGHRLSR